MSHITIAERTIGLDHPTYFIADISANHDGDLERAKMLVHLAAAAGADAAKFQNFRASEIVSDRGFRDLGDQLSHQAKWKKSVQEVYEDASVPWEWTSELKEECDRAGIHYFSTPYDLDAVDMLDQFVGVFKVGSGDITWLEMLEKVARKYKPVLLAAGASEIGEVQRAVELVHRINPEVVLMQCNTNYTGSLENFSHIHLNVLRSFAALFPSLVLGLSDHTPGHATVLGAVALGARVIEKHFTDDTTRVGPDHPFSMTPATWRDMVDRTRELELALGEPLKRVAANEKDTVVVQRRCLRAARSIAAGETLTRKDIAVLRPATPGAISAAEVEEIVGRRIRSAIDAGAHLTWQMFD